MRRGFKANAERISLQIRDELDLTAHDRLDSERLCAHLGLPVAYLSTLSEDGASAQAIDHFLRVEPETFSAMTVFDDGNACGIIVNPAHSNARLANSIAHEVSHVLLEHKPAQAVACGGCRSWNPEMEEEADWLAGALLVPRVAAVRVAFRETPVEFAAQHFGVSRKLMEWRLNHTGARQQAKRARGKRRRF